MRSNKPHVLIIGGGFGGLNAAIRLGRAEFPVTILEKTNFHLFQPLLYQVATGFLTPGDIASTLRAALSKYKTVRVIQDEVKDIDPHAKEVQGVQGTYKYDYLITAAGMRTSYFGHDNWSEFAGGLKSIEDALNLRTKVLTAFEAAERTANDAERKKLLTFVIIGGGPTGVELAGALSELARRTLIDEFRMFNPADCKVMLVEGGERILPAFHRNISQYAERSLNKINVEVLTKTSVVNIQKERVEATQGETKINIEAKTIIWAAGVKASEVSEILKNRAGAELDRMGRVKVSKNLTLPQSPDIFVIGDLAYFEDKNGKVLPGLAPVAMQQGKYVARFIRERADSKDIGPFLYFDKGNMAVIGKSRAVAETGSIRLTGFIGWISWAFIHIYFLIEFENRLIVFIRWAYNYLTNKRGSRLITHSANTLD